MTNDELILMHPGKFHTLYAPHDSLILNFLIQEDWFARLFVKYSFCDSPMVRFIKNIESENYYRYILLSKKHSQTAELDARLIEENKSNEMKKYFILEAIMIEFLCSVISEKNNLCLSESKGKNSVFIRHFLKYITENYASVNLDQIANYAGYSKTHICRHLRKTPEKALEKY